MWKFWCIVKDLPPASLAGAPIRSLPCLQAGWARRPRAIGASSLVLVAAARTTRVHQQACFPCRHEDAIVEEACVIEIQEQFLSPSAGVRRPIHLVGEQPTLLRNNRVLIFLTFLGSIAALGMSLCMVVVALMSLFPPGALNMDRSAAGALWLLGAWLMAVSQVFLWRQGHLMAHCSVLLDKGGAHFKLGNTAAAKEVFMPWSGIEAVHYKRIENIQKFTILGSDTSIVTFTSNSFYRPKRVARLIAEHAGLPLVRG
jgi:hypothetical protein